MIFNYQYMKRQLQLMKKISQKKLRGFTLIELMIAMAIIAVLATAGIQAYTGYIKKWRDTARAEIANKLNSAVISYSIQNNGQPPSNSNAFDDFLESASGVFISASNPWSGILVEDPVGGKEVCLDAEWHANQPCAFHYTAYEDGTYAISYGVESTSSTKENFYKTEESVPIITETSTVLAEQQVVAKYGIYTWTAKYIRKPATDNNNATGIDIVESVIPAYRSLVMNEVESDGLAIGAECSADEECASNNCYDFLGTCYAACVTLKNVWEACTTNNECTTSSCSSGYCAYVTNKADGQQCTNALECQNGYCGLWAIMGWPGPCWESPAIYNCTDGLSGAQCWDDSECESGFFCDNWGNWPGQCTANP
jgi:prepilin-type N-terminal cleavage/methylation domain-containing protein